MIMAELPQPRKTHVLLRGEYDKPRDEVQPGTPAALPPMPEGLPRNRLGLARWMTMPNHPLTARVAVNRFWQQLFGSGIVKTTEDFGSQGDWPSHPELLDWLAVDFVESGWDVKALLKQMVMSATYRQSSALTAQAVRMDPDNRLLSRGPRMRLDAEVIRDSCAVCRWTAERVRRWPQRLSLSSGGTLARNQQSARLLAHLSSRIQATNSIAAVCIRFGNARSHRRRWPRSTPPSANICLVRRSRTNTPLQAFVMLHDPQFVEAARTFCRPHAERGRIDRSNDRIVYGFRLCLARASRRHESWTC